MSNKRVSHWSTNISGYFLTDKLHLVTTKFPLVKKIPCRPKVEVTKEQPPKQTLSSHQITPKKNGSGTRYNAKIPRVGPAPFWPQLVLSKRDKILAAAIGGTIHWPFLEVTLGKLPGQTPFTPYVQIRDIRKNETKFGSFWKNVVENRT